MIDSDLPKNPEVVSCQETRNWVSLVSSAMESNPDATNQVKERLEKIESYEREIFLPLSAELAPLIRKGVEIGDLNSVATFLLLLSKCNFIAGQIEERLKGQEIRKLNDLFGD